ncbi:MAG: hypothetical protein QOG10_1117, partial [Kribbellaceae bacterium]|nr:hypothetical protein [Kribbellaceae bacterium]
IWSDVAGPANAHGLAALVGSSPDVGVVGYSLGGGIGYLGRKHGIQANSVTAIELVTADGELLRVDGESDEDLFWALRGGGGNFGVVTALEFRLAPVSQVYGGPMLFEMSDAAAVLGGFQEMLRDAPLELGGFPGFQIAPPLPFIPADRHGDNFVIVVGCWSGSMDRGEQEIARLRNLAPVVAEMVGPMPYPALNSAFDALYPPGLQHYWKANFLKELTDEAIQTHIEHGSRLPSVSSTVHFYPIDGACHQVPPGANAFPYRDAKFANVIAGMWPDPAENEANIAWVRNYYDAVAPMSEPGGYINFMADDDQGRIADNYKQNYERLVEIKRKYDPGNLFHLNQNIAP